MRATFAIALLALAVLCTAQADYCNTDYDCKEGQACVNNLCQDEYQEKGNYPLNPVAWAFIAPVGVIVTIAGAMFAMAIIMSTMAFISTPRRHGHRSHKVARGAWRRHPDRLF